MCHFTAVGNQINHSAGSWKSRRRFLRTNFRYRDRAKRGDGKISGKDRHEIKKCGLHSHGPVFFSTIFLLLLADIGLPKKTIMTNYFEIGPDLAKR